MRGTTAVFLAGGRGEGLGVLTEHRAPPAVPFGGKYRLVDFSLSNCHHSEISEVALLTQHAPTSLNEHVGAGRPWDLDRAQGGLRILQPFASRHRARWNESPGDALLRNLGEFDEAGTERLLVGSAEHVYLLDYSDLVASHLESGSPVTITVHRAAPGRARAARPIELHGGQVRRLAPEKTAVEDGLTAIGLFVFEKDFLRSAAGDGPPRTLFEWVATAVERGVPVNAFELEGFWADPVDLPTYYRTSMSLLAPDPPLSLADPLWTVETYGEERPPARFLEGSLATQSLVAGGSVVAGRVERSIVFGGVTIEEGASVTDSIVFQDVRVGAGAKLDHVIVDKSVQIGEGAVLGDGAWPAGPGELAALAVIGKEARLPDRFRLARGGVVPVADRAMAGAR
jgi:glucose-1-phosphate adenylyltransferase